MPDYACMESFHPIVKEWFLHTFARPSMPQELGWPEVNAGRNVLICAPTGSGKTIAAFLKCLDIMYQTKKITQGKNPGFRVVYISPLKALNNDIYRNLEIPIKGIEETAKHASVPLPAIKVAVRTGDTSPKERRGLLTNPPDILITVYRRGCRPDS
ncbi:MAG TPA: DEAD/DEAH box helicase [Methylomusa anaerophila]|uniref:Putative ATP-dependent helicase Lhr n=1 Tax=Methylomusa anaerophila TaxID=1930071 RepID=A0A348AET5_9FIRM|nr:DEAD/DEAH box helicase [Methylomusa anaerophila]BBB89583.1 putative ATP-dependent helicase Lhr [Methylomusa anaerophila]HML89643.1 DEAD/DEAH box helicase [Methylomusa anaerophila]